MATKIMLMPIKQQVSSIRNLYGGVTLPYSEFSQLVISIIAIGTLKQATTMIAATHLFGSDDHTQASSYL